MAERSNALTPEKIHLKPDELSIIKAARQDSKAFGELYKLYVKQVFRYLYSRIGNVHEVEDITAQTFLAAFESLGKFRQDGHFASWLFSIARNKAMDHFRQTKTISSIDEVADIPVKIDPLYRLIQSEQATALSKLILTLPEKDR